MPVDIQRLRVAVRGLATDAELCRMMQCTPVDLEPYRETIEAVRADVTAIMRYRKASAQVVRAPAAKKAE